MSWPLADISSFSWILCVSEGPLETEVHRWEGVSARTPSGSGLFSSQHIRKTNKKHRDGGPCEPLDCESFCLCGSFCVGPNSCCKVAVANGEALLFLVADDQVSPSQPLSGPSLVSGLPAGGA